MTMTYKLAVVASGVDTGQHIARLVVSTINKVTGINDEVLRQGTVFGQTDNIFSHIIWHRLYHQFYSIESVLDENMKFPN